MKIEFKKVGFNKKEITISKQKLNLSGDLKRSGKDLVDFDAKLQGQVSVECSRCGKEFELDVDEKLDLKLSDGVYRGFDEEVDVIEFYDGSIDMQQLIDSEEASIQLDYNICKECKEGEKDGSTKETRKQD